MELILNEPLASVVRIGRETVFLFSTFQRGVEAEISNYAVSQAENARKRCVHNSKQTIMASSYFEHTFFVNEVLKQILFKEM